MTELTASNPLPAVLREPPWKAGTRAQAPLQLDLPPLVLTPQLRWTAEARDAARRTYEPGEIRYVPPDYDPVQGVLRELGIRPEAWAAVRAGLPPAADDFLRPPPTGNLIISSLFQLPDAVAIHLWNTLPPQCWVNGWYLDSLLGRYGDAAAPGLIAYAQARPVQGLGIGHQLDCVELATLALKVRRGIRYARQAATDWLLTHPTTSAGVLLRQLFGTESTAREDARAALHELAAAGLRPALQATARDLGPAVETALNAELNADPLLRLPAVMPKLAAYVDPARLHRPRLKQDGTALPDDAVRHLALMLAISKPQSPYAGLDAVREACTPASLAEFVWDLFEAWWAAGAPSNGAWALPALGLFGNTGTVHRMGTRAMRLAREGAKNRAVALVDLLAAEGSDAALMHLDNLAERSKPPVVRNRATAAVDAVAEQRGLSRIELADRLVPTLGLGESRLLDFGPRQFHIGLDETLIPFVRDAEGTRLKDLPKPRVSDNRELADAAMLRYKQLKSELKTLAKVQLARLEQAMVTRRRWSPDDFRSFFVQHPLTREIAARLLWGVWSDAGDWLGACRIAEDGTLADAQDARYEPPADARLGIAHPVELPADVLRAFGQQFADYEILQPFPQLARETFALTPEEAAGTQLLRVDGQEVATGAVIGLLDRGWLRGPTGDGGGIDSVVRPFNTQGPRASLALTPGMHVTQLSVEPRQTLGPVQLLDAESRALPFSLLDAVARSEVLRDLYRLAPSAAP